MTVPRSLLVFLVFMVRSLLVALGIREWPLATVAMVATVQWPCWSPS